MGPLDRRGLRVLWGQAAGLKHGWHARDAHHLGWVASWEANLRKVQHLNKRATLRSAVWNAPGCCRHYRHAALPGTPKNVFWGPLLKSVTTCGLGSLNFLTSPVVYQKSNLGMLFPTRLPVYRWGNRGIKTNGQTMACEGSCPWCLQWSDSWWLREKRLQEMLLASTWTLSFFLCLWEETRSSKWVRSLKTIPCGSKQAKGAGLWV